MIKEYKLNRSNRHFLLSTIITLIICVTHVIILVVFTICVDFKKVCTQYNGMVFIILLLFVGLVVWSVLKIYFKYILLSRGMVIFWDSDNCELRFNYFGKDFIVTKENVENITIVGTLSTIARHSHKVRGHILYTHFMYGIIECNDGLQIVFTNMITRVDDILIEFQKYNTKQVIYPYPRFTKAVEQLGVEESNT